MSAYGKSIQVGRELVDVNADALRKLSELSAESFKRYVDINQSYVQQLTEVRELGGLAELQRSYGRDLWSGLQEDLKARGELAREAVEETGTILREAFGAAVEEAKATTKTAAGGGSSGSGSSESATA